MGMDIPVSRLHYEAAIQVMSTIFKDECTDFIVYVGILNIECTYVAVE